MPDTLPYCTWKDYSGVPMNRTPLDMFHTELRNIPINSLFLLRDDATITSAPPVVCVKTADSEIGLASFKFGLNNDHSIRTSGDTLVIPLCGDYNS